MGFLVRSLHIPCEAENKNQFPFGKKKSWPGKAILQINIGYYLLKATINTERKHFKFDI